MYDFTVTLFSVLLNVILNESYNFDFICIWFCCAPFNIFIASIVINVISASPLIGFFLSHIDIKKIQLIPELISIKICNEVK